MRILIVTDQFPPAHFGGMAQHAYHVAMYLGQRHDVRVVTLRGQAVPPPNDLRFRANVAPDTAPYPLTTKGAVVLRDGDPFLEHLKLGCSRVASAVDRRARNHVRVRDRSGCQRFRSRHLGPGASVFVAFRQGLLCLPHPSKWMHDP